MILSLSLLQVILYAGIIFLFSLLICFIMYKLYHCYKNSDISPKGHEGNASNFSFSPLSNLSPIDKDKDKDKDKNGETSILFERESKNSVSEPGKIYKKPS